MDIRTAIRDWWRGYSDADIASAAQKMRGPHRPGGILRVTNRELRAIVKTGMQPHR